MSFRRCHSNWKPKNLKQVHLWRYLGHEYQRFLGMLHRTPLCGQMSLRDSCRFLQCQLCPDITGYAEVRGIENDSNRISTGVFSVQTAANDAYSSHKPSEPNTVPGRLVFSASDSDSTYGRSSGVSVAAAYVLMIIKE